MDNVTSIVASSSEPYLHPSSGGSCSGIIENVHPADLAIKLGMSAMQEPYVTQTVAESHVESQLASLPVWLDTECMFATRQYFCSSVFLKPVAQDAMSVFAKNNISLTQLSFAGVNISALRVEQFYIPSYPHEDTCANYYAKCYDYFKATNVSSYQPERCNQSSIEGIRSFPTGNQTVLRVKISLNRSAVSTDMLVFETSPNKLLGATDTSGYKPLCPRGWVDPDHRTDPDNDWMAGSGCATACR
jgi:hypothetical protein